MPDYSQNVADLEKSVFFDSISLLSANGLLNVKVSGAMFTLLSVSDLLFSPSHVRPADSHR